MTGMPAQTDRVIVGVSGRIGSGKSEAARYLEREYGLQYFRYSLVLAQWRKVDPAEKKRLQTLGWDVMGGNRQRELNERLIGAIDAARDVVVDGLRHPIDAECLSSVGRPFFLLYIDTPAENRFQRLRVRFKSWEEFTRADTHPVESNIKELRARANAEISGAVGFEQFYQAIDNALRDVLPRRS